jgi:pyruvate dehydrogenase E1 component alpha subunit
MELATETAALGKRYEAPFLLDLYRKMVEIREVEEALIRLFAEGRMPGFIHSYIGEEATAVGVCAALRSDDYITSTHRGHGHILAKGGDLRRFMAEVFGRGTGYCGGKGGSMHIADFQIGILGANGVVGGGIPIAAGAACSSVLAGQNRVAVSFFGDGAADIGAFHESLNLAAIWNLPVVFVCENNGYADFISTRDHMLIEQVSERAAGYGIPGVSVDGNDVIAVHEAARNAVNRARAGEGPTLFEAVTYRWRGHYEGDPQPYRTDDEVAHWRERDPIKRFKEQLLEVGVLAGNDADAVRTEIKAAIDDAVEFAESSETPEPGAALTDVYTDIVEECW